MKGKRENMGRLRFLIALWVAKLSIVALKITGHNGTNFPGVIAIKICPQFLRYIGKPERIIAIMGTNGKTTVTNMMIDALALDGKTVVNNRAGSNINTGLATSLIQNCGIGGGCTKEMGIFEIDERSARLIYPYIKPEYMVVTNLSRDSIMRNGHPEYISGILTRYIPESTKLILNADDMFCSGVSPENQRVYFGIEKMDGDETECHNLINDFQICPKCHSRLKYEYVRYSHIGRAYCPQCGFKAPEYDYAGHDVDLSDMTIAIRDRNGDVRYRLLNDSVYNIYNVVSVVALLSELGYSHRQIQGFLKNIDIVGSRYDEDKVYSYTICRMLAKDKNAFATSRVFDYISGCEGKKEIIIMNSCRGDARTWSENICWMYDCDFELLDNDDIENIVVCGPRGKDYRLRLLMAGIPDEKISYTEDELDAPDKLKLTGSHIYVLYGTDSIQLGKKVADKVKKIIEEREEDRI